MNRLSPWFLAASLLSTTWLTGCRQVSTAPSSTPCGHCSACQAAAAAKPESVYPKVVTFEVAQGSNKEMINTAPDSSAPPVALPISPMTIVKQQEKVGPPMIVDGPVPPLPTPFPEQAKGSPPQPASPGHEEGSKLKPVAGTVPATNPALPTWTTPSEAPSVLPSPAPMASTGPVPAPLPALSPTEPRATSIYSHSDDYRVLVGQVQPWHGGWRMRYADFGTEDQHGGNVVLEGGNLERLQEGSLVRVQGTLIPSTERAAPARFQVQSVEILNR